MWGGVLAHIDSSVPNVLVVPSAGRLIANAALNKDVNTPSCMETTSEKF